MAVLVTNTVGGLLVDSHDRVLFGLRAPWKKAWPNHWDAVGGHVESGETIEVALIREVQEEIGVNATGFHFLATVENPGPAADATTQSHIFAVVSWTGGEPANCCEEHTELRWLTLEDLALLPNLAGLGYIELAERAITVRRSGLPAYLPT